MHSTPCKHCYDEICVNSDCAAVGDYCPLITNNYFEICKYYDDNCIPMVPLTDASYKTMPYYVCPRCKMGIKEGTKYCSICGQIIKWDRE